MNFPIPYKPAPEKLQYNGEGYPCLVCGRKVGRNPATVHMRTDGTLAPVEADVESRYDQGWWPVGSECKKLIPKAYRIG